MMRKLTTYIIGAALVSLSFMTTPAYADCAADLERLQINVETLGPRSGVRQKVEGWIYKARQKLKKGNEKGCAKLVKKGEKKMKKEGR